MMDKALVMPRRRAEVQLIGDKLTINLLKHLSEVIGKSVPLTGDAMETFRKTVVASLDNLGDFDDNTEKSIFSGRGPVANTIRDHLDAQRFIYGDLSEAEEKAVERVKLFDLGYSEEATEIEKVMNAISEARAICEDTFNYAAIERDNRFESKDDTNVESGLYSIEENRPHILHMILKPSDVLTIQLTVVGREQSVLNVRHVYENSVCEWDGTWTIKGLGEMIQEKIDEIKVANKRKPESVRDWTSDFEDLKKEAFEVLTNSSSLPAGISRYAATNETKQLTIVEAPYAMVFGKTDGDYPTTYAFIRDHFTRNSVPPTSVPEPQRSKLFNAAQVEIAYLKTIINKPTESTIDV